MYREELGAKELKLRERDEGEMCTSGGRWETYEELNRCGGGSAVRHWEEVPRSDEGFHMDSHLLSSCGCCGRLCYLRFLLVFDFSLFVSFWLF